MLAPKSSTEAEGVRVAAALSHKPFSKSVGYIYIYYMYVCTYIDFLRIFRGFPILAHDFPRFSIIPFF